MDSYVNIFGVVIASIAAAFALYTFSKKDKGSVMKQNKLNDSYDYIIVGAGSSGAVLAARLTEDADNTVLLIEAGGEETSNLKFKIPLMLTTHQLTDADWKYFTVPQKKSSLASFKGENRHYWPRGKVLGGSSQINYMQYVRGSRYDYDEWLDNGCEGWGYTDVLPYFLKSEDCQVDELNGSVYHRKGGPLGVTKERLFGELEQRFIDAGKELGYKEVDLNGAEQEGFGFSQVNVKEGERVCTARAFLRPAMQRNNLHVVVKSHVTKLNIIDNEVTGVRFLNDGVLNDVVARKEVILSAGAVGSPQILMLSGIGPKSHLHTLGIPVVTDLPVGDNLQDHLFVAARTDIRKSIGITAPKVSTGFNLAKYVFRKSGYLASTALPSTAFLRTRLCKSKYPDIEIHLSSGQSKRSDIKLDQNLIHDMFHEEDLDGITLIPILLHPKSRGTIRLNSADPLEPPLIDPNYLDDDEDVKVLIEALRIVEKLYGAAAMTDIGTNMSGFKDLAICEGLQYGSDEYWERVIRYTALTTFHPTSTCKMGSATDPTAVVDPQLRVKGVRGLRVVDASIMPNVVYNDR